MTNSC